MATIHTAAGRRAARWLTAACLLAAAALPARGAGNDPPPASIMLKYKPSQPDVVYTIPKAEEEANLKVEFYKSPAGGTGWILRDAAGKPLRLFFNSSPSATHKYPDTWSYYKDGVEVYREVEGESKNYLGKPDQFRWLNSAGSKWGVDEAKEGKIKSWKAISPEEVSQEVLQALAAKDAARFQALLLTEVELKALGLPDDQANRIREQLKGAAAKFQKTAGELPKFGPKATWVHLETSAPECVAADPTGTPHADVLKHANAAVLYESNGAGDYVQLGELIQVGAAWRLTDGPRPGGAPEPADAAKGGGLEVPGNPEAMKLIEELTELDKHTPDGVAGGPNPALAKHHLARVEILEKIAAKLKPEEREPWVKQQADSLSTAAQCSPANETAAYTRLAKLAEALAKAQPGSNVAAYAAYREMLADNTAKILSGKPYKEAQEAWRDRLTKYMEAYPKSDDAPEALLQLGMVCEFLDKDAEAKNWYALLKKNFADKPQAAKAAGAVVRLELEGKPLTLAGPTLQDPNTVFDVQQLHGKVVIVYYWASWNSLAAGDFNKLKAILDGNKGVELVCVNVDGAAKDAKDFLSRTPAPGVQLYSAGGLEGKLATDFGVMGLPNLFLVNKEGKVVSRNVQINNLDDEVKKLLK
jgi:hypothetical protein